MADWYVGQKVVCVDADEIPCQHKIICGRFVENGIYTIRGFVQWKNRLGILVEEVRAELWRGKIEYAAEDAFFRPLVFQDTDISVFTSILDRVNKREAVDA